MKLLFNFILLLTTTMFTLAQVGIGTSSPDASAILDIESTDRGLLPPRLSSDADVTQPPAEGLVIYDESDDCLNVYDGTEWINLCDVSGSGGSGGLGSLSTGQFPWANTIPFKYFNASGDKEDMSVGISQDGDVYLWGLDDGALTANFKKSDDGSVTDNTRYTPGGEIQLFSPFKIDDPKLNGKTIEAACSFGTFMALNDEGEIWGFGRSDQFWFGNAPGGTYFSKLQQIDYPTLDPADKIIDAWFTSQRVVILTEMGRVFIRSSEAQDLGTHDSDPRFWEEMAKPVGVNTTDFKYTRILNHQDYSPFATRALYVEGVDGTDVGVYAIGTEINAFYKSFGSSTRPELGTDPTVSSGITKVNFPAGVTVKHIHVNESSNIAITENNEWLVWGYFGRGSDASNLNYMKNIIETADITLLSNNYIHVLEPTIMDPPPGETGVTDAYTYLSSSSSGVVVVGSSGKVYIQGPQGTNKNYWVASYSKNSRENLVELWSTSSVKAKEIIIDVRSMIIMDIEGQIWGLGDLKYINTNDDSSFMFLPKSRISAQNKVEIDLHSYALPLMDTAFDFFE